MCSATSFASSKWTSFRGFRAATTVILSFNLLQRNYFPAEVTARGVDHLAAALTDAGLLVMRNTESFAAPGEAGWRAGPPARRALLIRSTKTLNARPGPAASRPRRQSSPALDLVRQRHVGRGGRSAKPACLSTRQQCRVTRQGPPKKAFPDICEVDESGVHGLKDAG